MVASVGVASKIVHMNLRTAHQYRSLVVSSASAAVRVIYWTACRTQVPLMWKL
jgi:hypothetical protein